MFLELRDAVQASARRLQATASVLATVDTLVSLAVLARDKAKLGLIFLDMGRAVKDLEKLI